MTRRAGIARNGRPAWTEDELAHLRAHWGAAPAKALGKALGGRNAAAIIGKARRLGLPPIPRDTRNRWLREGYRAAVGLDPVDATHERLQAVAQS